MSWDYIRTTEFANPEFLFLLIIPILFGVWQWWRYRHLYPTLTLPSLMSVMNEGYPIRAYIKKYLFVLRILSVGILILALARPQHSFTEENINTEGIDIMIALDVSTSMLARDFKPNRLQAAKQQALEFIMGDEDQSVSGRPNDRVGLVVFARESFTQCPLTTDHTMVRNLLAEIRDGLIEDGTAIGMGLATSVIRLKESTAKSKVIILLTDGENNSGFIDPLTAVETAKEYGIRVYTIGVGKRGMAPYQIQTPFGLQYQNQEVKIDEDLLRQIAAETNGKYFRATDNQTLSNIYDEIDQLETSLIQVTRITRTSEDFYWYLIFGLGLFVLELLLRYYVVPNIP